MSQTFRILAFDPGGKTGYVLATAPPLEVLHAGVIPWDRRFSAFRRLLAGSEPRPNYVIVEGFHLFPHKAQALSGSFMPAVQVIGAIEFAWWNSGGFPAVRFQPASCKTLVKIPDEHAEHFKMKDSRHAKDAFKHLRYFLITQLDMEDV